MRLAMAIVAVTLWTGCSVVVDPNAQAPKCTVAPGAADPCPTGLACIDGRCRPLNAGCTAADERCDGEDDDCDGRIDEGHDLDGDGFTWCGDGTADSTNRDCDDRSASVRPGGTEACDGLDNDCDGTVDGDGLCPDGEVCQDGACIDPSDCTLPGNRCADSLRCDTTLSPPACVPGGCMGDDANCAAEEECDPVTNACVPTRGLGSLCTRDGDCPVGVCVRRAAAGLAPASESFCTQACCSDADCPASTVCWLSGNGSRLCVPAESVGTSRGDGEAQSSCTGGGQCSSGTCVDGACLGNCATDADCDAGVCGSGYVRRSDRDLWQPLCVSATQGLAAGERCMSDDQCAYGACLFPSCGGACGTTSDCPADMYCGLGYDDTEPVTYFQSCIDRSQMQRKAPGESCDWDIECIDYACVDGACAASCCNDDDCPGASCRPIRYGDSWEMHCN